MLGFSAAADAVQSQQLLTKSKNDLLVLDVVLVTIVHGASSQYFKIPPTRAVLSAFVVQRTRKSHYYKFTGHLLSRYGF